MTSQRQERKPTVLVVDEDPFTVALMEKQLGAWGYPALSARNGREAIAFIEEN